MSLMKFGWNLLLFVVAIVLYLVGYWFIPMFMAFGAGTFSVALVFLMYHYITANILGDVNDKKEIIEDKNVAYAIYQVGIIIAIVISYLAAFAVFFTLRSEPIQIITK